MKPRHIQVAGSISEQATCKVARPPAPRTDAWENAFRNSERPAQKPREQSDCRTIFSSGDDIKILSICRPDLNQEKKPIRVVTLQDLILGEDWRVKELESVVRGGNRSMKALWVAGAVSIAIPLVYVAYNATALSTLETVVLLATSILGAAGIAAVGRYIKNTNLLAEQELQKARKELQDAEANK